MMIVTKEEFRVCVDGCNGQNPTRHKVTTNKGKIEILECLHCGSWMSVLGYATKTIDPK